MAPEVFTTSTYTQAVDWYAFGIMLWQLVTKDHPYKGMSYGEIINFVVKKDKRMEIPPHCHHMLKTLISQLWHSDPLQRPNFETIIDSLEKLSAVLEGSMLSAMAQETVMDMEESMSDFVVIDTPRDDDSSSPSDAAQNGAGSSKEPKVTEDALGEQNQDEIDYLSQTLTWEDVLQLEAKVNMQEMQLEVVRLRRELEDLRKAHSQEMADNHHRSMQSKQRIMEEHDTELRHLETSILQERMRQKIKLRKRLKSARKEGKPDLGYALSLLNDPKKVIKAYKDSENAGRTKKEDATVASII